MGEKGEVPNYKVWCNPTHQKNGEDNQACACANTDLLTNVILVKTSYVNWFQDDIILRQLSADHADPYVKCHSVWDISGLLCYNNIDIFWLSMLISLLNRETNYVQFKF